MSESLMVLAQVVPEILRKNYSGHNVPPKKILIRVNQFIRIQPASGPQCPKCAEMFLSVACLAERSRNKTNNCVDKVVGYYSIICGCFETSPSFLRTRVSVFF